MAEAIHCPSCSTRYRLRPERLKPVIRRAKCFTCGGLFPVGDVVQRLLALTEPSDTSRFMIEDLEAAQHLADLEAAPPTLTPGDLGGVDAEILEKTLVDVPLSLPETKLEVAVEAPAPMAPHEPVAEPMVEPWPEPVPEPVAAAPAYPPEITESTLSGYTSARDAIDKLLGAAPAAAGAKIQPASSGMDMEATMSALDTTLSGTNPPPASARSTRGDSPTTAGLTEEDLVGPATSTIRLSQADLLAALANPAAAKAHMEEPTAALNASDLLPSPQSEPRQAFALTPKESFSPSAEPMESGTELLRLKIGEDIYGSLTMAQLIAWVEEGRILENHLVARQHSENWLEAHKVPGLRPVFERLRRERSGGAQSVDFGTGEIAPKKSLFGGLFGKV